MSVLKKGVIVTSLATFVLVVGCAAIPYAREVKKKSEGGVIALNVGFSPEDRAKADSMMRTNCGNKNVKITEEGEVTVGQKTNADSTTGVGGNNRGLFGWATSNTQTNSTTTDVREWRITYDCVAKDKKG